MIDIKIEISINIFALIKINLASWRPTVIGTIILSFLEDGGQVSHAEILRVWFKNFCIISSSCQQTSDAAYVGDEEPCFGACDGPFPILGQSTTATKPCKRSLDCPSTGEKFETLCNIGSIVDLQRPLSDFVQRTSEFGACISAVGEDMSKPMSEGWPSVASETHIMCSLS